MFFRERDYVFAGVERVQIDLVEYSATVESLGGS